MAGTRSAGLELSLGRLARNTVGAQHSRRATHRPEAGLRGGWTAHSISTVSRDIVDDFHLALDRHHFDVILEPWTSTGTFRQSRPTSRRPPRSATRRRPRQASASPRPSRRRSSFALLDVLTEATLALNAQLSSGHVEVRLAGREPRPRRRRRRRRRGGDGAGAGRRPQRPHHPSAPGGAEGADRGRREQRGRLDQRLDRARAVPCPRAAARPDPQRQPTSRLRPELERASASERITMSIHHIVLRQRRPSQRRRAPARLAIAPTASGSSAGHSRSGRRARHDRLRDDRPGRAARVARAAARSASRPSTSPGVEIELVRAARQRRHAAGDRGGQGRDDRPRRRARGGRRAEAQVGLHRRPRPEGRRQRALPCRQDVDLRADSADLEATGPARRGRGQDGVRRRHRSRTRATLSVNTASGDVRAGDVEGKVEAAHGLG